MSKHCFPPHNADERGPGVLDVDSDDVDEVLAELTRQRQWTAHFYGGKESPHLIAFTFEWRGGGFADALFFCGREDAAGPPPPPPVPPHNPPPPHPPPC